ncbi:hypothetical protein P885DRAFT_28445 [Corynascus similis CBS 632.67]
MPPPHLHPRSRMTSSLFATTVLASFLVVALPHVLPCPAPARRAYYADDGGGDGGAATGMAVRRTRRRIREAACDVVETEGSDSRKGCGSSGVDKEGSGIGMVEFRPGTAPASSGGTDEDGVVLGSGRGRGKGRGRECPVPKPGGILGEWLGFNGDVGKEAGEKTRPDR